MWSYVETMLESLIVSKAENSEVKTKTRIVRCKS